jgi:guanine deaminase
VQHLPGRLIAPGFVDMHIHYPQTDVIGAPADGLLPWLEHYTSPRGAFSRPRLCRRRGGILLDELLRNGVTTALTFATSHPNSVDAIMTAAQRRGMRMIAGKVLQDRHSPDGVRDDTEQGLIDTETLIQRWHGVDRLGYAITRASPPPARPPSCGAQGSWRPDTAMCGSSPMCPRTWTRSLGARAVSCRAQLSGGVRRLRPDARARGLRPLHLAGRRRPRAAA